MSDSSEEKALPASDKKLRDSREKGKFAQSRDVVSATIITFVGLYVFAAWSFIAEQFGKVFEIAGRAALSPDQAAFQTSVQAAWDALAAVLLPMMLLTLLGAFLGALISNGGFTVSFHPLAPDLNRINPVEGFKRVFSLRNFVELLKSLLKISILGAAIVGFAFLGAKAAAQIPFCGSACVGGSFRDILWPILVAAILLFILSGMIDVGLQTWLFGRDMRMTHTEMKRERKDMFGDPTIRGERNRIRKESAAEVSATQGLKGLPPSIIITGEDDAAVALLYVRGKTPAPVVLAKAVGAAGRAMRMAALADGVIIAEEPDTAAMLLKRGRRDSFVPESSFQEIARILNSYGAIR